MAKKQLLSIAKKAQSMFDQLPEDMPLDDWMESHIAQMDMIGINYLEAIMEELEKLDLMEQLLWLIQDLELTLFKICQ